LVLSLLVVCVQARGRHRPRDHPAPLPPTTTTTTTTVAPPTTTTTAAPTPVTDENTAFFAFKIVDPKVTKRVQALHQAALKVSKDFTPFLIDPTKNLLQPLVSFHMEDDEKNRTAAIYDRQLQLALCPLLPRRLPYTDFRVVNGAMQAMSQTGDWMKRVKSALRDALNRQGFIYRTELDENMIAIMNPLKLSMSKIDLRPLKLVASANIGSLYICRGRSPSAEFAAPCDLVKSFTLQKCPTTTVKESALSDLIYMR
ncbi:hypothetical protein PENTCL1PPCAC_14509, partial [Pristionchus entomophagus]